mgnify:CR=1 FL=1
MMNTMAKSITVVLTILILSGFSGCDFSSINDATDNLVGIVVDVQETIAKANVRLVDAVTNKTIVTDKKVIFDGKHAESVIDPNESPITQKDFNSGFLDFWMTFIKLESGNNANPSSSNPGKVQLQIENVDGYLPVRKSVYIQKFKV